MHEYLSDNGYEPIPMTELHQQLGVQQLIPKRSENATFAGSGRRVVSDPEI
jgi:hypothetical protein